MSPARPHALPLALCAMFLFAGNSLLNRMALLEEGMPWLLFAWLRMASGAVALLIASWLRGVRPRMGSGGRLPGPILAIYMLFFSWAYAELPAAPGTLIFAAILPLVMVAWGARHGEACTSRTLIGAGISLAGLAVLLMPGLTAPSLTGAGLMCVAGVAWAGYCILARGSTSALRDSAEAFLRGAAILSIALIPSLPGMEWDRVTAGGIAEAVAAGAVTSGIAYTAWFALAPSLSYAMGAMVQLAIPVIVAAEAAILLDEAVGARLVIASAAVLGGIAVVLLERGRSAGKGDSDGA